MASLNLSDESEPNRCTLCGGRCAGLRKTSCNICHSPYYSAPCLETDRNIHSLLCRSFNRELAPDTRRGLRFACDRLTPDFVWLELGRDQSNISSMLEPLSSTVSQTDVVKSLTFPWSQASANDRKSTVLNPVRHRPMRNMCVYTTRLHRYPENESIRSTLERCENWLHLDLDIGVPPVENFSRSLRSWRGDLIFDTGPNSGGINATDFRDLVDFLSVCQQDKSIERGEMAARARKLKVVELDYQKWREDDPEAQVLVNQLDWPLDHPLLRKWRPPAPAKNPHRPFTEKPSGWEKVAPLAQVLKELRLPWLARETDPIVAPAVGSGTFRPRRLLLRKNNQDLDAAHVLVFVEFFSMHGRSMKGAFPNGSKAAPSEGTIHPFILRRMWQLHHYNYLKLRCVVPGCKGRRHCPLKPESHDCWSIVGKRMFKRVFNHRQREFGDDD